MNGKQLRMLLWKDWRQNGRLVVTAAIFLVLPYLLFITIGLGHRLVSDSESDPQGWAELLYIASSIGLAISVLLAAFFAGNAIAGERVDRSAEFIAYLPIPRRTAMLSKLVLAVLVCFVMLMVNYLLFLWSESIRYADSSDSGENLLLVSLTAMLIFGVAWLLSSVQSSPTLAASAGILTPFVLGLAVMLTADMVSGTARHGSDWPIWYCVVSGLVGLACLLIGSWHYLRRYSL